MKKVLRVIFMLVNLAGSAWAAGTKPAAPAKVDPAFTEVQDDPRLPRVMLIDDSVSEVSCRRSACKLMVEYQ